MPFSFITEGKEFNIHQQQKHLYEQQTACCHRRITVSRFSSNGNKPYFLQSLQHPSEFFFLNWFRKYTRCTQIISNQNVARGFHRQHFYMFNIKIIEYKIINFDKYSVHVNKCIILKFPDNLSSIIFADNPLIF